MSRFALMEQSQYLRGIILVLLSHPRVFVDTAQYICFQTWLGHNTEAAQLGSKELLS